MSDDIGKIVLAAVQDAMKVAAETQCCTPGLCAADREGGTGCPTAALVRAGAIIAGFLEALPDAKSDAARVLSAATPARRPFKEWMAEVVRAVTAVPANAPHVIFPTWITNMAKPEKPADPPTDDFMPNDEVRRLAAAARALAGGYVGDTSANTSVTDINDIADALIVLMAERNGMAALAQRMRDQDRETLRAWRKANPTASVEPADRQSLAAWCLGALANTEHARKQNALKMVEAMGRANAFRKALIEAAQALGGLASLEVSDDFLLEQVPAECKAMADRLQDRDGAEVARLREENKNARRALWSLAYQAGGWVEVRRDAAVRAMEPRATLVTLPSLDGMSVRYEAQPFLSVRYTTEPGFGRSKP